MPSPPFDLQVPLMGMLLALLSWLGLGRLARRCRPEGLLRPLLERNLELRQALLLRAVAVLERHGAALAPPAA